MSSSVSIVMWWSAGSGTSIRASVVSARLSVTVTPLRTSRAASFTRAGVRRFGAPRCPPSSQRPQFETRSKRARNSRAVISAPVNPGIAERWLSNDDWAHFRAWAGHPDADTVIAELEANDSLTPALNYYRANIPPESWLSAGRQLPPIQSPTMGVWSSGDIALTERQMTNSAENVTAPWRYERLDGPGHWMQLEAPDEVSRLLIDFLPTEG
jgi:pimeloyl-ACP methyl ester carboxylesterase